MQIPPFAQRAPDTPHEQTDRSLPQRVAAFVASALCVACGAEPEPAPTMDASRVVHALLDPPSWRCIEGSPKQIASDIYKPRELAALDEELPGLKLSTPSVWVRDVPTSPAGARLELATCVAAGQYRKQGAVTIELEWNGVPLHSETFDVSKSVPREDRRWHPASLELPSTRGQLTLRTRYEGTHGKGPEIVFGSLEVREALSISRETASAEQPNVVLVVLDTLRADRMQCYGHSRPNTPNLAKLAEDGSLFEQAFSSAPWTSPGTASILTSLTPAEHDVGGSGLTLGHEFASLAESLQAEGWTTAAFSCNPVISSSRHFDQGFEFFSEYRWAQSEEVEPDVLAWLEEHAAYRFFLYLQLVDPHDPYEPAAAFDAEYAAEVPEGYAGENGKGLMDRVFQGDYDVEFLERVARYNLARYDGEIASVDDSLGRIFARLDELGLGDDTLVCVTSDHGEEFMEHGMLGHVKQLHRESVHVPLLFRGPGVPAGKRFTQRVENRFVAPTLLQLCGIEPPDSFGSRSLFDEVSAPVFFSTAYGRFFEEEHERWSDARPLFGTLAGRWLYFRFPPIPKARQAVEALFDLENDPDAHTDVASAHARELQTLRAEIERRRRDARDSRRSVAEGSADEELLRSLGYIDGR